MCLNTGTPKNINFSFEINGKLMALGVPILKHFRVVDDNLGLLFFYNNIGFGLSLDCNDEVIQYDGFIKHLADIAFYERDIV